MTPGIRLFPALTVALALLADSALAEPAVARPPVEGDAIELPLSDPGRWIVDTTHLGTSQVKLAYDTAENVAVITPTWSAGDAESPDPAIRNTANSKLFLFQLVPRSDCTRAESTFEISVPPAYVAEGRLGVMFCLQGDKRDDYLFNGKLLTMQDFATDAGGFRTFRVKASDFNEPEAKRRGVERVGFSFFRNGSMVSAPIRIRRIAVQLNSDQVVPPAPEVAIWNPASFYEFSYTTPAAVAQLETRVSSESMDIARRLDEAGTGAALLPQWAHGQGPAGHPGNVHVYQSLGAPHDFAQFEVRYLMQVPRAYFTEGRIELYLCIQAGEAGHFVWSGVPRPLAAFATQAGQDAVLTLTQDDFRAGGGKRRDKIEFVGLQINRNGSTVTEPILLKRITVVLPK